MTTALAGLVFGLVGSGHCAAMCGPLVLLANPRVARLRDRNDQPLAASPAPGTASRPRLAAHVGLYHAGRLATYVVLGAAVGLTGGAIADAGLGRGLAVVAGLALVLQAVVAARGLTAGLASHRLASLVTRALGRTGRWMRAHRLQGPLVFGALNGLLPCGFLYAALVATAGLGDTRQALVFMAGFAIGTTPVLAGMAFAGDGVIARLPVVVRRLAPAALAIVGVLLIIRGVNAPHVHGDDGHAPAPAASAVHQH